MTTALTQDQQIQILTPDVHRLIEALRGPARVVGGAVRDVLLGREIGDIDLATSLHPKDVLENLALAGIKTVPTGFSHGTITAVIDHRGYEITTLRRDEKTDGRHAHVAFTENWHEDASRRDFTFNALYVDVHGQLYDYFGGLKDAHQGYVRFIGNPHERIREDVLRILRFFRFHAFFQRGDTDAPALEACRDLAPLIPELSAERIAREVLKLLSAPHPLDTLKLMDQTGVLKQFLPEANDFSRLHDLMKTEKSLNLRASPLVRMAAILPPDENVVSTIATRLKFSNKEAERLCLLAPLPHIMQNNLDTASLRRLLYRYGAEPCYDALFLINGNLSQALETVRAWTNPVFPLRGEDFIKIGITPGPHLGTLMRAVEQWWIEQDFSPDREDCLKHAIREHEKG